MSDPAFDCEGCGDILEPGVPHDCPVLGTIVLITETEEEVMTGPTLTNDLEAPALTARNALARIADQLSEFDSFAEGFDHEFHGDEPDEDGDFPSQGMEDHAAPGFTCRFDQANTAGTFEVLNALIAAAEAVVAAQPDELFEGKLDALAAALKGEEAS